MSEQETWPMNRFNVPVVGVRGSEVLLGEATVSIDEAEEFMKTARSMIHMAKKHRDREADRRQTKIAGAE